MRKDWLPDQDALRFVILAVPGLWLLFPVALFSTLSGSSRWFVLRPIVVWKLLRVAPSTFAVYVLGVSLRPVWRRWAISRSSRVGCCWSR